MVRYRLTFHDRDRSMAVNRRAFKTRPWVLKTKNTCWGPRKSIPHSTTTIWVVTRASGSLKNHEHNLATGDWYRTYFISRDVNKCWGLMKIARRLPGRCTADIVEYCHESQTRRDMDPPQCFSRIRRVPQVSKTRAFAVERLDVRPIGGIWAHS